ncbi:MAG: helix-turn-helix domain-containing protein, partial [Lachnospiraceae bacterium]|nr:helix-turn-helix domain-containing protein [Lachnospiraceae bacterium]
MQGKSGYFVVKQKAVPEVLLKVVEAKRLVESGKAVSIQEAVDEVGISRSSFYKYKDDIFPFHENAQGTTLTLTFQMNDETG